ncbi:MAG: RDD family protein [Bacteroidota bacterium]
MDTLDTAGTDEKKPYSGYAGFWMRFAAYLIDSILLNIITLIVLKPALALAGIRYPEADQERIKELMEMLEEGVLLSQTEMIQMLLGVTLTEYFVVVGATIVAAWLYFALMESSAKMGTLGKMALGLRVTDMEGNRISFLRATGRHFAKIVSGMTLLIGYIMAGFTEKKQALHDVMAGCLVWRK